MKQTHTSYLSRQLDGVTFMCGNESGEMMMPVTAGTMTTSMPTPITSRKLAAEMTRRRTSAM